MLQPYNAHLHKSTKFAAIRVLGHARTFPLILGANLNASKAVIVPEGEHLITLATACLSVSVRVIIMVFNILLAAALSFEIHLTCKNGK
jgi:hypothetical protein